jgi:hypothetical protein
MAFTEFHCVAGTGSNLNAGSTSGAPLVTYASGNWVQATRVFTVASGDPVADGVAVGDFVSVYADGASAPTGFVGRVTARNSTTITVSATASFGTAPTDGTGNRTLVVGGAWAGPTGASPFPIGSIVSATVNVAGDPVRVNFYNSGGAFSITAGMTNATSITLQGCASSPGDGGKGTIDGGTSGVSYTLLTMTTNPIVVTDMIFANNGASGTADGLDSNISGTFTRVVVTGMRGSGWDISNGLMLVECEAYGNNLSNTANHGGFKMSSNAAPSLLRCISHNNAGSNNNGFILIGNNNLLPSLTNCIADTNGLHGIFMNSAAQGGYRINGCVSYNNGGDGIRFVNAGHYFYIENTILANNTGTGINLTGTPANTFPQSVVNCGFIGNAATTAGINASMIAGSINFGSAPFVDAANGNFAPVSAQAQGAGRGAFTQTSGYTATTTSFPDVGAAQVAGGSASAAFIGANFLGRRSYQSQVTRRTPTFLPGNNTVTTRFVTVRMDNHRTRSVAPGVVRRPPPTLVPLPSSIITVHIPFAREKTRVVTVHSRPQIARAFPVVRVEQVAIPLLGRERQYVRHMRIVRREPAVVITPPPQTVIISSQRVVR